MNDTTITTARALFPRGLHQPEDSYRFGADALLLAAFAAENLASLPGAAPRKVAELGSGCGAALLGLWQLTTAVGLSDGFLISSPSRMWGTLVGLCRGGELLRHIGVSCLETVVGFLAGTLLGTAIAICMWWREGVARVLSPYLVVLNALPKTALGPIFNARLLGLDDICRFRQGDLADTHLLRDCGENAFHLILANPPYALADSGRHSASARRDAALRGPASLHDGPHARQRRPVPKPGASDPLAVFCHAARRLLRHHGLFCCIFPAAELSRLLSTLERERLGCRRILPLCPRAGEPAKRVLVLARKDAAAQCLLEAPLPLHHGQGWSPEALAFCSWLGAGHEEKR